MDRWDYSLADLAVVADTHRSTISHLLAGRQDALRADRAQQIARALHVDLDTLFVAKGTPVPNGVTWSKRRTRPSEVRRILAERHTDTTTA